MKIVTILGLIAGMLTTASFLPQVIKTLKLKETKDISLWMYVILCVGILMWMIYGLLIEDFPIIIANMVALILTVTILVAKLRYG